MLIVSQECFHFCFRILLLTIRLLEPWLLVAVTPQEIRERVNLTEADISDATVNRFAKAAAVTLGLELEKTIDYTGCSDEEAEAIRNIAAIYCACKVTGGSASGLSFRVGDLAVNESSGATPSGLSRENLQFLMSEAQRIIEKLKVPYVGRA
jgi:hypothetical protein